MNYLLYLIFWCDFDVMKNFEELEGTKHNLRRAEGRDSLRWAGMHGSDGALRAAGGAPVWPPPLFFFVHTSDFTWAFKM